MDLMEIGWEGVGWIYLAEDGEQWRAVTNTVMNLQVLTSQIYLVCENIDGSLLCYEFCGMKQGDILLGIGAVPR
jgi:hypothetical protein